MVGILLGAQGGAEANPWGLTMRTYAWRVLDVMVGQRLQLGLDRGLPRGQKPPLGGGPLYAVGVGVEREQPRESTTARGSADGGRASTRRAGQRQPSSCLIRADESMTGPNELGWG
jgi:hypothetical protein